jgi:hypothetical protein
MRADQDELAAQPSTVRAIQPGCRHRRHHAMLREMLTRLPDIRAAGEPDYLLSSFIHGIKHLPCEFG